MASPVIVNHARGKRRKLPDSLTDRKPCWSDLGDIRIAKGQEAISGCQGYLCIAWFGRTGLVVQHGRRGYTLPVAPAKFPAKVKSAWRELRER